jgi:hypothetical protein
MSVVLAASNPHVSPVEQHVVEPPIFGFEKASTLGWQRCRQSDLLSDPFDYRVDFHPRRLSRRARLSKLRGGAPGLITACLGSALRAGTRESVKN